MTKLITTYEHLDVHTAWNAWTKFGKTILILSRQKLSSDDRFLWEVADLPKRAISAGSLVAH